MFKGFLSAVVALISVPALFWLGMAAHYWWDHRPPHYPVAHVLMFSWTPPDSLAAQLAAAKAAEAAAKANEQKLSVALADQTQKVEALGKQSARIRADSAAEVAQRLHELAGLQGRLAKLKAPPKGADRCARADDALATLKETLGP